MVTHIGSWSRELLRSLHDADAEWFTTADETTVSCSSQIDIIYEGWNWQLSDILSDKLTNLANSTQLVVAGAEDLRDVSLHGQLTVKVNAEIANVFHWTDDRRASIHGQVS